MRAAIASTKNRRAPRSPWRILAWVLVAAGLALLALSAWELYGTNLLARERQDSATDTLRQAWDDDAPMAKVEGSRLSALVHIPALGNRKVPLVEGTGEAQLALGFAHFTHSAGPGQRGNFALAAHRVTHGEPLRDMPALKPGDKVIVETRTTIFTYVLDTPGDALRLDFTQDWVLDDPPVNPDPRGVSPGRFDRLLTLSTCAEFFHTNDRLVAFGHLESARKKSLLASG